MFKISPWAVALCLSLTSVSGCGGSTPEADTPDDVDQSDEQQPEDLSRVDVSAEIGALPVAETEYAFKEAFKGVRDCFTEGSTRQELISGEIAVKVLVNSEGQAEHVFAERSTLGDDATERCMFDALRAAPWPKPEGGLVGIAQNGFTFNAGDDVRPPVIWESHEIQSVLDENSSAISGCKSGARGVVATMYVDTDGKAIGVGISGEDEKVEQARECLVRVLGDATYPSPGSWPAKVSVQL